MWRFPFVREISYLTISGWHVYTARGRITGNLEGCFRIADEPAAIGQCYGARPDFGLIVDITTTRPCREWAPIIARNFGTTYQASMNLEMVFFLRGRSA